MFHACEVKMTKIDAASRPRRLLGKSFKKKVSATGRKTRMGMDWRKSRGRGPVDEREKRRKGQGNEHARERAQRVVRQIAQVRGDPLGGMAGSEVHGQRSPQAHADVEDGEQQRADEDVR
jgi:hypothetical protein